MSRFHSKILLAALHALVYGKRAVVWLWRHSVPVYEWFDLRYQRTLGFWTYKFFFLLKSRWRAVGGGNIIERRRVVQAIILLIGGAFMLPHSRLSARSDTVEIPGQKTVLYRIIGPGDQDFAVEEITAELPDAVAPVARHWREGAIGAGLGPLPGVDRTPDVQFVGQSMGGMALVKPVIQPGASLLPASPAGSGASGRTGIIIYEVQPGDVLGAIAMKYGVSVMSLLAANNLTLRSYIRPGDKLKVLPVDGLIHVIRKGDTIGKIVKLYQASSEDIFRYNRMSADDALTPGFELIVPHGVRPAPAIAPQTSRRYTALQDVSAPPGAEAASAAGFIWPTAVRRVTQYFGLRHTGTDIGGPMGTPVYAARSGKVIKSQCGWNGGYGCYIVIDHGGGVQTLYGHNSQLLVETGNDITQGQTIALMGSTGRSTGSHLHFEVRVNGRRVNPLKYIR